MKRPRVRLEKKQFIIIGVIVLLVLLMADLNNRLNQWWTLEEQADAAEMEYNQYLQTATLLQTKLAYATSEAAVEEYARNRAHMALPGDKVIVPLEVEGATPVVETTPTTPQEPVENWEIWWALIMGD